MDNPLMVDQLCGSVPDSYNKYMHSPHVRTGKLTAGILHTSKAVGTHLTEYSPTASISSVQTLLTNSAAMFLGENK